MPGLSSFIIKPLGQLKFFSHQLKLGSEWKDSYSVEKAGEMAKKEYLKATPSLVPPWFTPAEIPNKFHQESCDKIGQNFKDFHDNMLDAVAYAHQMWQVKSKLKDVKVMAVCGIGTPGCMDGPELESDIKNAPQCASWTGNMQKHRDAVAKGVSKCFKDWQDKVTVPGLPWWPAFAAFPGPTTPPMPNIPVPLIICVSAMVTKLAMPDDMKKAMDDALDGGMKDKDPTKQFEALHDAIATVLSIAFVLWLAAQMVMNVMGKGPCPAFSPPFVPVSPVVNGDHIGNPHVV